MANPIIDFIGKFQSIATRIFNDWWWAIIIGVGLLVGFVAFRIFIMKAGV